MRQAHQKVGQSPVMSPEVLLRLSELMLWLMLELMWGCGGRGGGVLQAPLVAVKGAKALVTT